MPLNTVKYPIIFNAGVDTKTDDKLVNGRLVEAENIVFPAGIPNKRLGYKKLSTVGLTEGRAIAKYKEELLHFGGSQVRSYAEPLDEWISKGSFIPVDIEQNNIFRSDKSQFGPDIAVNQGIVIIVWEEEDNITSSTTRPVRYSIYSQDSETYYVSNGLIAAEGKNPRVVTKGSTFIVVYQNTNGSLSQNLESVTIPLGNPQSVSSPNVLSAVASVDGNFDLVEIDNNVLLCYERTTNVINIAYLEESGIIDASFVEKDTTLTTSGPIGLTTLGDSFNVKIFVTTVTDANLMQYTVLPYDLSTTSTPITIGTFANVGHITGIAKNDTELEIIFDTIPTNIGNSEIQTAVITESAVTTAAAIIVRSLFVTSKPFRISNVTYFIAEHSSTLQPTHFIVNITGCVLGTVNSGLGGLRDSSNHQPCSVIINNEKQTFPLTIRNKLVSGENTIFFTQGISETILDFGNYTYSAAEQSDNLFIGGGQLFNYDGDLIVENNFLLYPEGLVAASPGTGFNYVAVYKWTDNQGFVHYSTPSLQVTSTSLTDVITIPTIRITEKPDVVVELYRTEQNGTLFYFCGSGNNNKTVNSIDITPSVLTDDALIAQKPLYTTGGILENTVPPTASLVEAHKNRIFLAGLADRNKIAFSKLTGDGNPVGFNLDLTIPLDPKGGPITALQTMDDYLIIFKRDNIYVLSGEGPTNQGVRNFPIPRLIASDVGCVDTNSVALMPTGIVFKSAKGIYLVSRSLQTVYIGADVQKFNNESITSAILVDDDNEVRFTTSQNKVLVWNYYYNNWSTFTSINAVDAELYRNQYVFIQSDGEVNRETPALYKDNGKNVSIKLVTEWIKLDTLTGFQRVKWVNLIGEYKSQHKLRITLKYNYSDFITDTFIYSPDGQFNDRFESDEFFSATKLFGNGNSGVYEVRIKPKIQKCESIQITIEDIVDSSVISGGESFNITSAVLEIGAKNGIFKQRNNKTI